MNEEVKINPLSNEQVIIKQLDNGLTLYFCKKPGFKQYVGMLGTKYGSIDYDFISKESNERVKVSDGIAHFLEHKLFEQENGNILDLFAKMGVSSNAYTSFDHTVYFFETSNNFNKCLESLFKFVSSPYFTDKNVEKEKGIIEQEINMYEDEPTAVVYYKILKNMYKNIHLNVDIAGTVDSIKSITKEMLYDCYRTFYNPKNMFCIIIGDLDIKEITNITNNFSFKYMKADSKPVIKYLDEEPYEITEKESIKRMPVATNYICIGFKTGKKSGKTNALNNVIVDIINEACFSKISDFNEKLYNNELINEPITISYEAGKNYSHIILSITTPDYKKTETEIIKYIEELKSKKIELELFETAKKRLIGDKIFETEEVMTVHRTIIDSILQEYDLFTYEEILKTITKQQVDSFINNELDINNMSISRVIL